jgi:hypothetical protein
MKFTLRMDHKSLVWLHRFRDTEGMLSRWMYLLQQFNFVIIHCAGQDHVNADGLFRVNSSPCTQCTRPDCKLKSKEESVDDQSFDSVSTGSSMDTDLLPVGMRDIWLVVWTKMVSSIVRNKRNFVQSGTIGITYLWTSLALFCAIEVDQ